MVSKNTFQNQIIRYNTKLNVKLTRQPTRFSHAVFLIQFTSRKSLLKPIHYQQALKT